VDYFKLEYKITSKSAYMDQNSLITSQDSGHKNNKQDLFWYMYSLGTNKSNPPVLYCPEE